MTRASSRGQIPIKFARSSDCCPLRRRLGHLQLPQQFPHDVAIGDDFLGAFPARRDALCKLLPRGRAFRRNGQGIRLGGGQAGAELVEQVEDDAFLHEDLGVGDFAVIRGAEPQQTVQPVLLSAWRASVIDA